MRHLLSPLLLACACNGGQADASGFGTPTPTSVAAPTTADTSTGSSNSAGSSSTAGVDSTTSTSTSTSSNDSLPPLDMAIPDFGPGHPIGCEGRIDFVFVISTAGTMKGHQEQLALSFPGFLASIQEHFPDFDVRILSAKPNKSWSMVDCTNCEDSECDPNASPPNCGVSLTMCDQMIGAGVTFPAGTGAANRRCDFFGGHRYIVGDDPKFEESFACMTQAGMNGGTPHAAEAMVKAISPEFNAPGGCNEGFLRDDALLVVTILNDDGDVDSEGTVESWIEALLTAKHGNPDAFAVLVLTTDVDLGYWQLCHPDQWDMSEYRLRQLANSVDHGFVGSICQESYTSFFDDALAEIVALCENLLIPQ